MYHEFAEEAPARLRRIASAAGLSRNELLSRQQIEAEYGNGDGRLKRWLELAALRGDGPPMVKISRRMVRYRRSDLEDWLKSRTVRSTSQSPHALHADA